MPHPLVERIRQLRRTREVWQGDIVRVPQWLAEEGQAPVRPWIGVWANPANGKISASNARRPHEKGFDAMLEAMAPPGLNMATATRPEKVQVATPGLAEYLRQQLEGLVEVELVEELPAIRLIQEQMRKTMASSPLPGALTGAGVTLERIKAFNEAADLFYAAAPWQYLSDEDYIHVESPAPPDAGLAGAAVMGAQGKTFGLAFYKDRQHHLDLYHATDMRKFYRKHSQIWTVLLGAITELPQGDADLVEDGELPQQQSARAFAVPKLYDGVAQTVRRPNAAELAYMEGVMRAIAASSEGDFDSGRWNRRVRCAEGEVEFVLVLPGISEEIAAPLTGAPSHPQLRELERALDRLQRAAVDREFGSAEEAQSYLEELQRQTSPDPDRQPTATERAQDLVDLAWHARGRRRRKLIKEALEIDPNCPEAYVLMGAMQGDAQRALEHYQRGVEAGERALGREALQQNAGEFWGRLDTRPYMRARLALAENLRELKRTGEAIEHFKELIRLNPTDQQGARFRLMACLLESKDQGQLEALFQRFDGEKAALWAYGRALWMFRREGDTNNARKEMWAALEANHFAANYLLGKKEIPAELPNAYTPHSEAEAAVIALELKGAFEATPNALHFLNEQKRKKRDRDDRKRHER